jgi:glycosyltransferase involved in cell wall biosynthesis
VTGSGRAAVEPLISVILAVRRVGEYLPGCLDSILGQPDLPAGIEVIAVDDASPDGCGANLDTRAAADPRPAWPYHRKSRGRHVSLFCGNGAERG